MTMASLLAYDHAMIAKRGETERVDRFFCLE